MQSQQYDNQPNSGLQQGGGGAPRHRLWSLEPKPATTTISPICSPAGPLDDLDIILLHEDFPFLLSIAAKAKETRRRVELHDFEAPSFHPASAKSSLQPSDVFNAVDRMQHALLARPVTAQTIPRGQYPITDAIMEDAMLLLQREHECGEEWLAQQRDSSKIKQEEETAVASKKKRVRGVGEKSDSIAIKYAKWQTDILMNWIIEHHDQPFPDQKSVDGLMASTGLSHSQVINWTTNVRKRNRKATCERGKKPHHFIDFLFLVQDREDKMRAQQGQQSTFLSGPTHYSAQPPEAVTSQPLVAHHQSLLQHRQHYQLPPPPQHRYANGFAAPNTNIDPMAMDSKQDDLMEEFADAWLDDDAPLDPASLFDEDELNDMTMDNADYIPSQTSSRTILASVTSDSNSFQRARASSFEFASMDSADIKKWANDIGDIG
jgi:Homeobox KN domain